MVYIIKYFYQLISDIFQEHRDPRVIHLPLVGSPMPALMSIIAYLAFVLHYGPKWMEKRKPFDLKYVMRFYNAIQVLANFLIFIYGIPNSYMRKEFSFTCQPIEHTNTEPWMRNLINLSYCYYLTKYLDLLDTVFIVLRKKNNQITFLHVYHHAGMIFGVYVFMIFLAGSHGTMLGIINLLVHTVMYFYYFATSMWPIKKTLRWKRYITLLQLLQFGYLIIHFLMPIVFNHCQYPIIISFTGLAQNLFMFAMFFDFYYKEYIRKPKLGAKEKLEQQEQQQTNQIKILDNSELQITKETDKVLQTPVHEEEVERLLLKGRASRTIEKLNTRLSMNDIHSIQTSSLLKTKCS